MVLQVSFDLNFYSYGSTKSIVNDRCYRRRVVVSSCRLNDNNKRFKERTWSCTEKSRATRINKILQQNDSCKLNDHMLWIFFYRKAEGTLNSILVIETNVPQSYFLQNNSPSLPQLPQLSHRQNIPSPAYDRYQGPGRLHSRSQSQHQPRWNI